MNKKIIGIFLSIVMLTVFVTAQVVGEWVSKGGGNYERVVDVETVNLNDLQDRIDSLEDRLNYLESNQNKYVDSCVEGYRYSCELDYMNELANTDSEIVELQNKLKELK